LEREEAKWRHRAINHGTAENPQNSAQHRPRSVVNGPLLLVFLLFSGHPRAQELDAFQSEFERSPLLNGHFYGFSLYDLDSGRFLMDVNGHKHFTPASNTKVFTLHASLKGLGDSIPGIHYLEKGDSLIFWGTGDPTFLHRKLDTRRVYDFLKNSNKKLYYADETEVEEPFYRDGWAMEDYDEPYQPELSTFPIYGNVAVFFRERGDRPDVSPAYFRERFQRDEKTDGRFRIRRKFDANTYIAEGKIPYGYLEEKPFRYSAELFVELLRDTLGKRVERIRMQKPDAFGVVHSASTREVLREMMVESDNFLAEQLHMLMALRRYGKFHTARFRKETEMEYGAHLSDEIRLRDGSGLSVYNKVTPRAMVELLLLIRREIPDRDSLLHFFPAGGVDGTLKTAYPLAGGKPFVWAKTGTISSVHCQSGFIRTANGRNFAFSFLNNNFLGSAASVRREVARILTLLRSQN